MGVTAAITYVNLTQVGGSSPMNSGLDSEPGGQTQIEPWNLYDTPVSSTWQ